VHVSCFDSASSVSFEYGVFGSLSEGIYETGFLGFCVAANCQKIIHRHAWARKLHHYEKILEIKKSEVILVLV
jgi:hypothetical protein